MYCLASVLLSDAKLVCTSKNDNLRLFQKLDTRHPKEDTGIPKISHTFSIGDPKILITSLVARVKNRNSQTFQLFLVQNRNSQFFVTIFMIEKLTLGIPKFLNMLVFFWGVPLFFRIAH